MASPKFSAEDHAFRAKIGRIGALSRLAHEDARAMTAPARAAAEARFAREVDPEGRLAPEERARRAQAARRAFYARLALRSVAARKRRARAKRSRILSGKGELWT